MSVGSYGFRGRAFAWANRLGYRSVGTLAGLGITLSLTLLTSSLAKTAWAQESTPTIPRPANASNSNESSESGSSEQPPEPSLAAQANSLLQQGYQHYWNSEFDAAIEVLNQALGLYEQIDVPVEEALVFEGLGLAYEALGDCPTALDYQRRRYTLAQELGDRTGEGNAMANIGNCYYSMGRYQESLDALRQSLVHWQQLGDRGLQAAVMANIGNVYTELGHYEEASAIHQSSLVILEEIENYWGVAASLNSLGLIAASQGNAEQAYVYYEQSLERFRALNQQPAVGQILNNLGTMYHQQGETEIALGYYQQSLEVAQELGDRALEGDSIIGIGLIYSQQEDYKEAIEIQQYGVDLARSRGDMRLVGTGLANLADTLWLAGELDKAETALLEAIDILDALRSTLNDRDRISIFDTQLMAYNILQEILVEKGETGAALEVAERGRARAFVQLLAERMDAETSSNGLSNSAGAIDSERLVRMRQDRLSVDSADIPTPTLDDIRRTAQQLDATLVQYSILPDSRFISLGKLRGDDARLLIWVVQPSGDITFHSQDLRELPIPLEDLVRGSRNTLARPQLRDRQTSLRQRELLQALHQILIEPIASSLPSEPGDRVILIPQNYLFLAPFPALMDAEGTYLIEHHTLLTAPSIQVLDLTYQLAQQRHQENPLELSSALSASLKHDAQISDGEFEPQFHAQSTLDPSRMLIVGNPVMPSISTSPTEPPEPLVQLPAAETEAVAIAQLFAAEPLIGAAATEVTVTERMGRADLIHLATHGLLDYGQTNSGILRDIPGAIALTPTAHLQNDGEVVSAQSMRTMDGLLTASEVIDMELQADLVVLSACNTGRGDITGDGVIGLSRSFISAGVPSVIVSLWTVPDAPTSELMVEFYTQLQQAPDKAYALRQAMLTTLDNHPSPINWAAFTLMGSP
ncbi:MAG: CHAT domain-containing protein [Elainellaceae cyanobacterium]